MFNMATYALRDEINLTSGAYDDSVSEPELAKLEMVPSRYVKPPRIMLAIALDGMIQTHPDGRFAAALHRPRSYSVRSSTSMSTTT